MSKETLRRHLLTPSSAETPSDAGSSLLSCFTNAGSPRPLLQRLSAGGEAMDPCSEKALKSWFDPLEIVFDEAAGTLGVRFPHAFFGLRFSSLFQKIFERNARELWGKNLSISYGAGKFVPTPPLPFIQSPPVAGPEEAGGETPFGEEWTFETFIGNGRHKWALSLARDIATRTASAGHPAATAGSPAASGLFVLCGPHGTGKTHLLRAVGNELFRTLGNNLYCASLSDLELLYSGKPALAVRQELFVKEALLLDDFQHLGHIPDKPSVAFRTQAGQQEKASGPSLREELCLLLDRFMDQGKTVVIAGEGRPRDWAPGKALGSRLETGLWAELPEPDIDVRLRYAQRQVRQRQFRISREQLQLIAQYCPDMRRLSGMLLRVASHRSLLGHELSEQDLLSIVRQGGEEAALTPQVIISIVGERCGFSCKDITGEKRRPDLVQARQIAMFLCRELLGHSYPVIGRVFGGKDHSTVMHGVKKIKLLQKDDRLVHSLVTELTKACLEYRI